MLTRSFRAVGISLFLFSIQQLPAPSVPHVSQSKNMRILEVPIKSVSVTKNDKQLQLWIEGDRLAGCNLLLDAVQKSQDVEKGVTEIRIQVFHSIVANSKCTGRYVPFGISFNVQQAINEGKTYRIKVNNYHFVVKN